MKTIIVALFAFVLLAVYSCSNEGGGFFGKLLKGGGSAVPVTVESVVVRERSTKLNVPITLESSEVYEVILQSDASIDRIFVREGDVINSGDTLIRVSEQDLLSKITKLKNDLREAQTQFDKNSYLFKNRDRLLSEGKIEKSVYDALENDVQVSESAMEKLQGEITRLEEKSPITTISSPMPGAVSKINTSAGNLVQAGRSIMTIVKFDPMIASFRLPSYYAPSMKAGTVVMIKLTEIPSGDLAAKITSVGTEIDIKDNAFAVKASIANPSAQLKSGMRGEVEFITPEKQKLYSIPQEALIKEQRAYFVYTVAKGIAHRVQVIPDEIVGNRVEIVRGLNDADIVVVKGHDKLTEGTVVDIWGR